MFHPRPLNVVSSSIPLRPCPERLIHKPCQNGRAYISDPSTGHPICLCHLETHPAHSFHAHPAFRGIRTLASPRSALDDSHIYQKQLSTMTSLDEPANGLLPPHLSLHQYGAMYIKIDRLRTPGLWDRKGNVIGTQPEGTRTFSIWYASVDVSGVPIRKTAARETTGPLKVWLRDHKKNPYPTKAEKIMLAIITRMTLTQVSTWFANARRRLKKDKRLSAGEGEEESVGIDSDRDGDVDSVSTDASIGENSDVKKLIRVDGRLSSEGEGEPFSDVSDDENDFFQPEPLDKLQIMSNDRTPVTPLESNISQSETFSSTSERSQTLVGCSIPDTSKPKPKIWSISHILNS